MTSHFEAAFPSRIPHLEMSSSFDIRLRAANRLDRPELDDWLFLPGMLFDSSEKWWNAGGKRATLHEGLDVRFYRNVDGVVHHLDERSCIVPVSSGRVIRIVDDFLGRSVFLAHDARASDTGHLLTAYGHLDPFPGLRLGDFLAEEQVFATIARGKKGGDVPPHLHISVAWASDVLPVEEINWKTLGDRARVLPLNPLSVLGLRCKVVEHL